MSVRSSAGYVQLIRFQTTGSENPPIFFPGITPAASEKWSFCIWVKQYFTVPNTLVGFNCIGGSNIIIQNDGIVWHLTARDKTLAAPSTDIGFVLHNRWQVFCFAKSGANVTVYAGVEDPLSTNPWERPVTLTQVTAAGTGYSINDPFYNLVVAISNIADVCCFKYWNQDALTKEQFEAQANRWDTNTGPVAGPGPIWASPLRTAGDIGNIANPYTSLNWEQGHMWDQHINRPNLITAGQLGGWNDPAYLATAQPCPTWLYPVNTDGTGPGSAVAYIDPGLTPAVPTFYKAVHFIKFVDKGSVPHNDSTVSSIRYYGFFNTGADVGTPATEAWGLYRDHNNAEVSNTSLASNSFMQTGNAGLTIPGSVTATNMYRWGFGAEFLWNPVTPQGPTKESRISQQMLYVIYTGFPTGRALAPKDDLSGLFVVNKPKEARVDIYNNQVSLRIPNPTIRTAYIGE